MIKLAAPLIIIQKVVQTGCTLKIILHDAAREEDIGCFIRLFFNLDGGENQLILSHIKKESDKENLINSEVMEAVDFKKEMSIQLPDEKKIFFLEFFAEKNPAEKRKVLVE